MTLRQRRERTVRIRIELDENEIPNLDATRILLIHQRAARIPLRCKIDVYLRARSARTGVAHHPEIVGLSTVENVDNRIEIGFAKQMRPVLVCFLVEVARLVWTRLVHGRVKSLRWKFPALHHQFPCPLNRFLFEVIAEAPVAEHLEKGVVISIKTDIFEIVMFSSGSNAFLCIGHARRLPARLLLP